MKRENFGDTLGQPYHFKFSNLNLIISFVFANCFTQIFNILSLNSTSNNAASSPIKCHSWQSRHICWYATNDTPFIIHTHNTTLHCTILHYTYTTLVNDTLCTTLKVMDLGAQLGLCSYFLSCDFSWIKSVYLYTFLMPGPQLKKYFLSDIFPWTFLFLN